MKLVHVVPIHDGGPSLNSLLKGTERKLRGGRTTLIRQKGDRLVHAQYPGWITWEQTKGGILNAVVKSRKPQEEWMLLSSFIGYLERHMSEFIQSITITYRNAPSSTPTRTQTKQAQKTAHPPEKAKATVSREALANSKKLEDRLRLRHIAVDQPKNLRFKNVEYVITGRFDMGYQRFCKQLIKKHGGTISAKVTSNTGVVVVGALGSPNYLWDKYGKKIEKADRLRKESPVHCPVIIMENTWRRFL